MFSTAEVRKLALGSGVLRGPQIPAFLTLPFPALLHVAHECAEGKADVLSRGAAEGRVVREEETESCLQRRVAMLCSTG